MNRVDFFCSAMGVDAAAIAKLTGLEGLMAQAREKTKPLNLKVTDLKTFIVNAEDWLKRKQDGRTSCKGQFVTTQKNVIDPVCSIREGIANLKAVRKVRL